MGDLCNHRLVQLIILNLRTLLYISYYFPPCGLSGVIRAVKFVKWLPWNGWRPLVLCAGGFRFLEEDETLLAELPDDVRVERVSVPEPYSLTRSKPSPKSKDAGAGLANWFSFPDTRRLWISRGFKKGLEIIRKDKPSLILATSPPYSSLILGKRLSQKTGLPLVLDYRDLWHGNSYRVYPTRFHESWNLRAEKEVLSRADAVITINDTMAAILRKAFGVNPRVIKHGYDPDDFSDVPLPDRKGLMILYAGSFFRKTDPSRFLDGLALVRKKRPEVRFSLTWLGTGSYPVEKMIEERGLSKVFRHIPYTNHRESCRLMQEHNLLWALVGPDEGPEVSTVKAYDYLGAGRAILITAPENTDAARLARETGSYICPPDDPEAVFWTICQIYSDLERGTIRLPKNTEKYSISERTAALARILDEVI